MSNPWIRLYRESLHDPKIVTLSDRQHRAWHNLLLIADDAGMLPPMRNVASHMRVSITEATQLVAELIEAELVDVEAIDGPSVYRLHGWSKRQYVSDSSTERSRKFRAKSRCNEDATLQKRPCNVAETAAQRPQTSESESESKSSLLEQEAPREAERKAEAKFFSKFEKGKGGSRSVVEAKAEGLGVPVADLRHRTHMAKPRNPDAYFKSLCVSWLRSQVPKASDDLIAKALTGDAAGYTVLTMALMDMEDA